MVMTIVLVPVAMIMRVFMMVSVVMMMLTMTMTVTMAVPMIVIMIVSMVAPVVAGIAIAVAITTVAVATVAAVTLARALAKRALLMEYSASVRPLLVHEFVVHDVVGPRQALPPLQSQSQYLRAFRLCGCGRRLDDDGGSAGTRGGAGCHPACSLIARAGAVVPARGRTSAITCGS